jgi:hypothetical protein
MNSTFLNKVIILLAFAGLGLGLSSCAKIHMGVVNGSAQLSQRNFTYNGQAKGESSAVYIFGIGGNDKEKLIDEAWMAMNKNFPLKDGQAYANVRYNLTTQNVLGYLYMKRTQHVTADIVTFK